MTLYEQAPESWDRLAAEGKPSLRTCAKMFNTIPEMADALKISDGLIHQLYGKGSTFTKERIAKAYLAKVNQDGLFAQRSTDPPVPAPQAHKSAAWLVVPPEGKEDAVRRVLGAMGCLVEDV